MTLLSGMAYAFDPCLWHRADQEEFWHEVEVTQYHMDQELGTNISCHKEPYESIYHAQHLH